MAGMGYNHVYTNMKTNLRSIPRPNIRTIETHIMPMMFVQIPRISISHALGTKKTEKKKQKQRETE